MPTINVVEQLTRIPAQPLAAKLILRVIEDPDASPAQLARLVEMDPALSARVMRLANSPHYAIHEGVNSAARAVILLGVSTVRGLAAAAASSLLAEDVNLGPTDYWTHTVSVAAASAVAADVLGVPENEAFTAGLLHDTGASLFHRAAPAIYDEMVAHIRPGELGEIERTTFGYTHAEAGAIALEEWHFPRTFVRAVATHHDAVTSVNALAQTIILGEALAEQIEKLDLAEGSQSIQVVLADLGVSPGTRTALLERAKGAIDDIGQFFGAAR